MRHRFTSRSRRQYKEAPPPIQSAFDQRLAFLLQNLRHPSLRAKKYDTANDVWQARITKNWRFYFQIQGDTYIVLSIIPHPK